MSIEFAWNTQKNQMSDIKGKEREQEREGQIKNDMIDRDRTHLNYDLVQSELNLYQRAKERVDQLKSEKKRVQKNSVITYSNIITIPESAAKEMSNDKMHDYFKTCHDYFVDRFGKENVLSSKIHLDESTPHMHLHFMPIDKETGRLQARTTMNKAALNEIHDEIPERLRAKGFDVVRGSGEKTKERLDIHQYKAKKEFEKEVESLGKEIEALKFDKLMISREIYQAKSRASVEIMGIKKKAKKQIEDIRTEAKQTVSLIQKEVETFKYDITGQQERLIMDTQDMNGLLNATKKDLEEHQKQLFERIDSLKELDFDESVNLDLKPNLLNKVSMSNDTFLELKKRAEVAERMQRALQVSEQRNKSLEKSIQSKDKELDELRGLRVENRQLQRQIDFFKKVIEKIKVLMTSMFKEELRVPKKLMDQYIGYAKFEATKSTGRNIDIDIQSNDEKAGFDLAHLQVEEQKKERDIKSPDMER